MAFVFDLFFFKGIGSKIVLTDYGFVVCTTPTNLVWIDVTDTNTNTIRISSQETLPFPSEGLAYDPTTGLVYSAGGGVRVYERPSSVRRQQNEESPSHELDLGSDADIGLAVSNGGEFVFLVANNNENQGYILIVEGPETDSEDGGDGGDGDGTDGDDEKESMTIVYAVIGAGGAVLLAGAIIGGAFVYS